MSGEGGHISTRRKNRLGLFGGLLPSALKGGFVGGFLGSLFRQGPIEPTEEDLDFYKGVEQRAIIFGEWEKEEILFLLENKRNAINNSSGCDTTTVYCPKKRRDELVEILKEKFGMLTFGEGNSGKTYIAVDNINHVLLIEDDGNAHFVMHCTQ